MSRVSQRHDVFDFSIPSEVAHVERIVSACEDFVSGFGLPLNHSFGIVVREVLRNAVIHGNQCDPAKKVCGFLSHEQGKTFTLTVEDEGEGFDYQALDMSLPDNPAELAGRGCRLINALSDKVTFNEEGNRVTVRVSLDQERDDKGR